MNKEELEKMLAAETKWRDAEIEKLRNEVNDLHKELNNNARAVVTNQGANLKGYGSVNLTLEIMTFADPNGEGNYGVESLKNAFEAFATRWNRECSADMSGSILDGIGKDGGKRKKASARKTGK